MRVPTGAAGAVYRGGVEVAELETLLTTRMLAAVDAEAATKPDPFVRSAALRRAGFTADETAVVLTQADLRRRARAKFGDFADRMLFTRAGLEQATRLQVATHHAGRMARAGVGRVADLGCGIGGDALAFAGIGLAVLAIEQDEVTAAIAQVNLAPFAEVEVRIGDAETTELAGTDAVWLDPARRTAGHTDTRRSAVLRPSAAFASEVARDRPTGVKLSPAHDREELPFDGEAQWVSDAGEVVELVVWSAGLARPGVRRAALVLRDGAAAELTGAGDAPDEPVAPPGAFVHEPDGAVIRARLIGDLARNTGTRPIGPGIAYLSGDAPVVSPFLSSFRIEAVLPLDRQRIRAELRARRIGRLEVKKRGVDLDPASFRRALALSGDGEATLIATRTADRRVALLCRRLD